RSCGPGVRLAAGDGGGGGSGSTAGSGAAVVAGAKAGGVGSEGAGVREIGMVHSPDSDTVVDYCIGGATELHHVFVFGFSRIISDAGARAVARVGGGRFGIRVRNRRDFGRSERRARGGLCGEQEERRADAMRGAGGADLGAVCFLRDAAIGGVGRDRAATV